MDYDVQVNCQILFGNHNLSDANKYQ